MKDEIIQIIATELGVPASSLGLTTRLRGIPDMDSTKVLTIILQVEKRFDIEIPDDATFRTETVEQFVDLVARLKAGAAGQRAS